MAWLESHQSLRDHPKKDRLAELLFNGSVTVDVADLAAIGILHRLWWWALDYAQDGDLSKFSDRQIAKGCGWNDDARLLVEALTTAGFLERKPRRIHDWEAYAGRLIARREEARMRTKKYRERIPYAYGTQVVPPTNQPTNIPKGRISSKKSGKPVDNSVPKPDSCPQCETVLVFEDGVARCPVCEWKGEK